VPPARRADATGAGKSAESEHGPRLGGIRAGLALKHDFEKALEP
jgi:hypothetical protein